MAEYYYEDKGNDGEQKKKKKIQPVTAERIFVKRFGINMVLVEDFSCFMSQQQFKQ